MASGSFDYLLAGPSSVLSSSRGLLTISTEAINNRYVSIFKLSASSSGSAFSCSSSSGSSNISIQRIQGLSQTAVNIKPPVTDEVLLVEEGTVGAEEAVLGEAIIAVVSTDVEGLAVSIGVSIVTLNLSIAKEGSLRRFSKDWVVLTGHTRDVVG